MGKKLANWIGTVIMTLLVAIVLLVGFAIMQVKDDPQGAPSLFGYTLMNVLTGSMEPEIAPGDIVLITEAKSSQLQQNDVITFRDSENTIVTHRINEVISENGETVYQTKGDANNTVDEELITTDQIIGSVAFTIPNAGHFSDFIKNPIVLAVLSGLIVFILTVGLLKKYVAPSEEKKAS
uniref:signal peptidase I n=1 Tax=uncultured Allobacillus sp. TaxID=1638025 RepID=UPI002597F0CA|nr:signal peptidase I [uncultured Allobacillus sp.]